MKKERPYEFVPLYALMVLIQHYEELIKEGFYKQQSELNLMKAEIEIRFKKPEQDKQISIEEYMRSRSRGEIK